jgi:hypothetical protein
MNFHLYLENSDLIATWRQSMLAQYPGTDIEVWANPYQIELATLRIPAEEQGGGKGTAIVQSLQEIAKQIGLPIVVRPDPEPRKKAKLISFYRRLGFVPNKGRYKDYTISSPFASTMYWRP